MRATKQPWGAERTQIAGFTVQKGKPRWSKGVGLIQGHPSGYHCCLATKSCPTLCNPMDCSPPDSSVHGILQARKLEWVAISFTKGSSQPRDWTCVFFSDSSKLLLRGCSEPQTPWQREPWPSDSLSCLLLSCASLEVEASALKFSGDLQGPSLNCAGCWSGSQWPQLMDHESHSCCWEGIHASVRSYPCISIRGVGR